MFESTDADISDLGEERGHRVLRVCGKGTNIVLVPLPPAVGREVMWVQICSRRQHRRRPACPHVQAIVFRARKTT
jgi:hypothetical protein